MLGGYVEFCQGLLDGMHLNTAMTFVKNDT